MSRLEVSEIFYSLQGESTFAGLPCVFVRLAGCNLCCRYCDTRYACAPGAGRELTVEALCKRVAAYAVPLVEVTGGEPLLQAATPELLGRLLDQGRTVLVETNGSLPIAGLDPRLCLVIDVKTPGSGEVESFLDENLVYLRPERHQLKFVLVDEYDFFWSRAFLAAHPLPAGLEVIFSPVSGAFKPARLAELMLEYKVCARLQLQLHKLIWPEADRGC